MKFEYAASGARLKIIDAIRYSRRQKRSNGLPTWSFDGGFDKPGFERPQVLPLGKGSGFEQIVSRLPEPQRIILEMFYGRGLTLTQIAAITETPVGTVKSQLSRALVRLREDMVRKDKMEGR